MKVIETKEFCKLAYADEGTLPGFKQPNKSKSVPGNILGEPGLGTSVKGIQEMWGKDPDKKKKKKKNKNKMRDYDDDKMPKTML